MSLRKSHCIRTHKQPANTGRLPIAKSVYILDAPAFCTAIEAVINFNGSLTAAAKALGFSKPYLSKLRRIRHGKRISRERLEALQRELLRTRESAALGIQIRPSLPVSDRGETEATPDLPASRESSLLRDAIVLPATEQVLAEHNEWLGDELAPLGLSEWAMTNGWPGSIEYSEYWNDHPSPLESAPRRGRVRANWMALDEVYADRKAFNLLNELEQELVKRGYGSEQLREEWRIARRDFTARSVVRFLNPRGFLAIVRSLDPVVTKESMRPGAVPRSMVELGFGEMRASGDLHHFLEISSERELMLLDREPDFIVAQRTGHFMQFSLPLTREQARHKARRRVRRKRTL
jgi:hypothetical protein